MHRLASLLGLALALAPLAARADAPQADRGAEPDTAAARPEVWSGVERPWLYAPDPTAPPPGHVIAGVSVGYAQVDRGAARPFAGDIAHAGAVFGAGAEVGVLRHVSLQAEGLLSGTGASAPLSAGATAGASFYPLRAESPVDVAMSAGYLRELGGGNGAWARAAIAGDLGRARLSVTTLGERVFEPGRDGMDLLVTSGVSYALLPALRLGQGDVHAVP